MKSATGFITIVQEDRFRLNTADGKSLLLILKHNANACAGDLERWKQRHEQVTVQYDGDPDFSNALVKSVRRC